MAWLANDRLRALLGESILEGGNDEDTFFSDEDIQNLLDENNGLIRRAAYEGWEMKAANYANLMTVSEGNALRQMSDLFDHAQAMLKQYSAAGNNLTAGRARVGRIVRKWY